MKTLMLGTAMAAVTLAGCNRGTPANAAANQPAPANAAAPVNNAIAHPPEEAPNLAIDEERLVATCVAVADRDRPIDQFSAEERTRLITCINAETARQLSARLPIRLDSRTQVERMTAEGPVLTYHYRVTVPVAELPAGVAEQLDASTRASACAGGALDETFAMGGVHVYRWTDRDGVLIREIRIASC